MFRQFITTLKQVIAQSLVLLLRVYQILVSPLLGQRCRFYPSCSHYSQQAISHYGVCRGIGLTIKRLGKCQPFHEGGYDPLPLLIKKVKQ